MVVITGSSAGVRCRKTLHLAPLVLVLALLLSACTQPVASENSRELTSRDAQMRYAKLLGDNGLLFSPDFWGSLYITYEGEIAYRLMAGENLKETWPHTPEETFTHLQESSDAIGAAYMIVEFDLFDDYSFLTDLFPDMYEQWNLMSTQTDEAIFTLYALHTVISACHGDVMVAKQHKDIVRNAFNSEFTVEHKWAEELAHAWNMKDIPPPNTTSDYLMAEEIPYALWSDYLRHVPYSNVDHTLVDQVVNTRLRSDSATARLYRALMTYGDTAHAEKVKQAFDTNRLLSDGTVLEMPIFNGTLDSTFRMARYISETQNISLDQETLHEVVDTLEKSLHGSSHSDALLAAASLAYLAPEKINTIDIQEMYRAFLKEIDAEQLVDGHKFDIEELHAWIGIASYVQPLGITIDFPGIRAETRDQLLSNVEENVVIAYDLIIVLHDLGILNSYTFEKEVARSVIESYVHNRSAHIFATSVAMPIELAYSYLGEQSPFHDFNFSALTAERSGDCVGGYSGLFLKEFPSDAPCTVDGSRYAYHLEHLRKDNKND